MDNLRLRLLGLYDRRLVPPHHPGAQRPIARPLPHRHLPLLHLHLHAGHPRRPRRDTDVLTARVPAPRPRALLRPLRHLPLRLHRRARPRVLHRRQRARVLLPEHVQCPAVRVDA